jgi:nicotinamide-nucleotide amidase
MTPMWEEHVEPTLVRDGVLRWRTLKMLGIGESAVEEKLDQLVRSTSPTVATYAKNDGVHVRIADKAATAAAADERIGLMEREVRARLGEHIWGTDGDTLGGVVGRALVARDWRLAVADALTGGELGHALADAPEAERWFAGALVRPGADADALERDVAAFAADVRLMVPAGASESELRLVTPDRSRRATVRYRSAAEGRRRALLGGLDLLRRALAD